LKVKMNDKTLKTYDTIANALSVLKVYTLSVRKYIYIICKYIYANTHHPQIHYLSANRLSILKVSPAMF